VAGLGAWLNATAGRPAAAERWAEMAKGGPVDGATPSRGPTADGTLALVRAALCRDGIKRMRADAEAALTQVPAGSASQATAYLLVGISFLMAGDHDGADRRLADAIEAGEGAGADSAMVALSERALLAIELGAWQEAETLAEPASSGAGNGPPERDPTKALLHAVTARLAIRHGDVPRARGELARAEELRPQLT
jgi:LuxR family transcriptional regulator, maltose regulon positive regulatory protein